MMRKLLLAVVVAASAAAAQAQDARTAARAEGQADAAVRQGEQLEIAAGTRLAAQLQQTLDVRKARVGDEVVLKTTEAVRSNGRTIVKRGAKLFGRVTEVHARARGEAESRIGLVFDRIESGSLSTPITATIAAVTQAGARAQASAGGEDLGASAGGSGRATAGGTAQGGGGLLGGVGQTVGGVTSTVGGAAGTAVDTTTGAVGQTVGTAGSAAGGLGRTVRGLRVTQSTSAEASGSSTLSLTGGDLKLEKNTTFHLLVAGSAGAGNN